MPKKSRSYHHVFRFDLITTGKQKVKITSKAKVMFPSRPVELTLTAGHVLESLRRKGVADIHNCSMAICTTTHADQFPHKYVGYIDWFYSRAYIASKLDARGLPIECYCYTHSDDIAQFQDTVNGQKRLLAELRKTGPRVITLRPVARRQTGGPVKPWAERKGPPTRAKPKGAKLRHATARAALEAAGFVRA